MQRRWVAAVVAVLGFGVLSALSFSSGDSGSGAILAALGVGLGLLFSPVPFPPSVTAAEADTAAATDGMPIVYWRPGCQFCLRLRTRLGRRAGRAHWVDIWQDPDAAARVREITGGFETVPTVVIDGQPHVNPDPSLVLAAVSRPSRP